MSDATRFNRQFYDEFWRSCPDFSRYNPGVRHRRRILGAMLRQLRFDSLLDVGCGDGENLLWLRGELPAGVRLHGVDLSGETVARNRSRLPFASFDALDLRTGSLGREFGAVLCTEVIEHIDGQAAALGHLAAMVAPGGHALVTCPTGKVHATERAFGHVRHPTRGELRSLLEEAGLRVVTIVNWGWPLYVAMKHATNWDPDWALKNFATREYGAGARLVSRALYGANFFNVPSSPGGCQLFALARRPG